MTRDLDPKKASGYMTKAINSLDMAKIALQRGAYDNSVMSAIHSSINALDALVTSEKGKRSTGSHIEVLTLVKGILDPQEFKYIEKQFKSLLSLKNTTEYEPELMSQDDADVSIKSAERILDKVKARLAKKDI